MRRFQPTPRIDIYSIDQVAEALKTLLFSSLRILPSYHSTYPNDEERTLSDFREELESIDLELSGLVAQLDAAQTVYEEARSRFQAKRRERTNVYEKCCAKALELRPIMRLPNEVLADILLLAALWYTDPFESHHLEVCKSWSSLIKSTPRFWDRIVFANNASDGRLDRAQLKKRLELAHDTPLWVTLAFGSRHSDDEDDGWSSDNGVDYSGIDFDATLPDVDLLLDPPRRIRRLDFVTVDEDPTTVQLNTLHAIYPLLTRLDKLNVFTGVAHGGSPFLFPSPPKSESDESEENSSNIWDVQITNNFLPSNFYLIQNATHLVLDINQRDIPIPNLERFSQLEFLAISHLQTHGPSLTLEKQKLSSLTELALYKISPGEALHTFETIEIPFLEAVTWQLPDSGAPDSGVPGLDEGPTFGKVLQNLGEKWSSLDSLYLQMDYDEESVLLEHLPSFPQLRVLSLKLRAKSGSDLVYYPADTLWALGETRPWLCPNLEVLEIQNLCQSYPLLSNSRGYEPVFQALRRALRRRALSDEVATINRVITEFYDLADGDLEAAVVDLWACDVTNSSKIIKAPVALWDIWNKLRN